MSLNAQLNVMSQQFAAQADPEILEVMRTALQELEQSGLQQQALAAGETMPAFVLNDSQGGEFSSRAALQKGPLLISWYRGIW